MQKFREALLTEVIPQVERAYHVSSDRNSRAIAGLSMGGAESLYTGLNTLDHFAWVGAFSATVAQDASSHVPALPASRPVAPEPRLTTIASLRGLLELRRLAREQHSLDVVLEATARIIADSLGLDTVVINLRRTGTDLFDVVTVVGDQAVRERQPAVRVGSAPPGALPPTRRVPHPSR